MIIEAVLFRQAILLDLRITSSSQNEFALPAAASPAVQPTQCLMREQAGDLLPSSVEGDPLRGIQDVHTGTTAACF